MARKKRQTNIMQINNISIVNRHTRRTNAKVHFECTYAFDADRTELGTEFILTSDEVREGDLT